MVRNVTRLAEAVDGLRSRDAGTPGMGLVYGYTGVGKSTAVAWMLNQVNGLQTRAAACWTPTAMLGALMHELGAAPLSRAMRMVDHIVGELRRTGRPVFVDEADYLLQDGRMLETLRDIHDLSGAPVILIGMEGIERRLVHRPQLAGRVSQWVEFRAAGRDDARILADKVCEVQIAEDLLERLWTASKGSMRLMVVGLSRIEAYARAQRLAAVDEERWGNRQLFLPQPEGR
jgi:DNA transposition AAA+ family ATPase